MRTIYKMSLIKTMDGPDIRLPISGQEPELDIRIVKFDIRSYNESRGSGKCTVCCYQILYVQKTVAIFIERLAT